MNVLLDTQVVLDAMIPNVPHSSAALKLYLLAAESRINAYITVSCATDIYYLLNNRLRNSHETRDAMKKLFTIFRILEITEADCEEALLLELPDYKDALLVACGQRSQMDCIITRDLAGFEGSPIQIVSPDVFAASFL